jgi:hypothetical protein
MNQTPTPIYYICDLNAKVAFGAVTKIPDTYGNQITGMADLDEDTLADLTDLLNPAPVQPVQPEPVEGQPAPEPLPPVVADPATQNRIGFLKTERARAFGIDPASMDRAVTPLIDIEWGEVRAERDIRIQEVRWVIERHNDEVALGGDTTLADINPHLDYVKELRDLPTVQADPFNIAWPVRPSDKA